ncbi:MAG: TatD family hydrolase [Lachnospiraceae bacterium]|jgi:TatD DNase family protein|nr:TatD family hydrolase [Lachnospiraceae bacterium]
MIFDSHAHYDDRAFDTDRDELLAGLPGQGVGFVVNVGSTLASLPATLSLAAKYPFVYGALGLHPSDVAGMSEETVAWIKENTGEKVVAIGEIGLDYYWDEPEREIQKKWFIRQLELAREVGLPIVVHSREAAKDTLDILRAEKVSELGGVMHCFSYTKEIARECLEMNLHLGIGGVVTFKNAQKIKEVVAYTPLERILVETDCPYLAPVPYRGKRNNSAYLTHIVREIADIKGLEYEAVVEATTENARRLFRVVHGRGKPLPYNRHIVIP